MPNREEDSPRQRKELRRAFFNAPTFKSHKPLSTNEHTPINGWTVGRVSDWSGDVAKG